MLGFSIATYLLIANPVQTRFVSQSSVAVEAPTTHVTHQVIIPAHLYLPPNPPAPGKAESTALGLPYVLGQRTTNYYHASASQAKNIELVAKRLNGVIVKPGATFSYNHVVGPFTQTNGFGWGRAFDGDRIVPSMGGGVCQGASTLYSALLRTDLPIVERHNHGLTVPYLPAGEDATVAMSVHYDFRFQNNHRTSVRITARAYPDQRLLTIAVWGAKAAPDIDVQHRVLSVSHYRTVTHSKPECHHTKVVFPGQDGAVVQTWKVMKTANGRTKQWISQDTYLASPRIIMTPQTVF